MYVRNKKFSEQEDEMILKAIKIEGKNFNNIAKYIPGRTAKMIKNRYYSKLKKYTK
jgi:hypothetical protein